MEYLGIDVGSSYLKLWCEDESQRIIMSRCIHHRGSPKKIILDELSRVRNIPEFLCYCGKLRENALERWGCDGLLAEIDYLKTRYPHRHLLIFGAEKIEFVHYDGIGRILSLQTNPACAAGTGSFLDEQMNRLGLSLAELDEIPVDEKAPMVASRCAVFAKTDLIHLQQEGYSAHAMYNGLCKGLVVSGLKSVFGGNIPDGDGVLLSGGLISNPHIRHFLRTMLPKAVPAATPMFLRARGVCDKARLHTMKTDGFIRRLKEYCIESSPENEPLKLELTKSCFPSQEILRRHDKFENEIWHDMVGGEVLDAYLGVDIGSTSTKAVLVDRSENIRLDIYTATAGNPIQAARQIFKGISHLKDTLGISCTIKGCSTTGSGRKLIGKIIGADLIINEISAHAKGAVSVDESVETIFEIGGQDAKFIRMESGRIVDVNMNYVCAAGTGSFIEEQASTMGMSLDEIGEAVMGVHPLANSDRCTVFMNQEITAQLAAGYPKDRIMAGVLLAVFKNYLGRVVGNRYHSRKTIVFQGATARNKGLVAALEQISGATVKVSPFCHVMGAYGAALLVKEKSLASTTFKGFGLPEITVRETTCKGCENTCTITTVWAGSEKISWGFMCGREEGMKPLGRKPNPAMKIREDLLKSHVSPAKTAAAGFRIPALGLYEEFLPLFNEIAHACNISLDICYPTKEEITDELSRAGSGDFCYPIKVAMACTNILLKKYPADKVLLPFLIQEKPDEKIHPQSRYCPFITGLSSFYKTGPYENRVFAPVFDLSRNVAWLARQLKDFFEQAGVCGVRRRTLEHAVRKGLIELERYRCSLMAAGKTLIERIPADSKIIVLLGRSYNLYHQVLNLGIPELVESLGYTVIPMDIIPDEAGNEDVVERFPDMYWYQGQKILRKALSLKDKPNMFPLMISNFSCGPDSFILSYFEEVSREKPYLILELDEHGSATGYRTRIEAFCDMIEQYRPQKPQKTIRTASSIRYRADEVKDGNRIWIPQIHPYIPQLWAATLGHHGFHALPMGEETSAQCSAGRAFCRGSECLPAAVTIGKFLSCAHKDNAGKNDVLFMPRSEGPCRFGQYATLQSRILQNAGLERACIFSPTSQNGYAFLSREAELDVVKATCLGDMLFKLRCRTMPYHPQPSTLEMLFNRSLREISNQMLRGEDASETVRSLVHELNCRIDYTQPRKPLVGIVGEIFVRLNTFSNQHVVETIESNGGEAWLSPFAEWVHYVLEIVSRRDGLKNKAVSFLKKRCIRKIEEEAMGLFSPVLDEMHEPPIQTVLDQARRFLPLEFEGEAILTLGRAKVFAEQGASLVVNCSPFGCMPGRITAYIFQNNPAYFGVPIVNLFFDGIGDIASQVAIYLKSISKTRQEAQHQYISSFKKKTGRMHPPMILEDKKMRDDRPS